MERELAPLDVTAQQAALLLLSAHPGGESPNRLGSLLGVDPPGMTRLLDRLEAKGLALRRDSPKDRRSVLIETTPEGHALMPQLGPVFEQVQERCLTGFSEDEEATLRRLLHRMITNLGSAPPPC